MPNKPSSFWSWTTKPAVRKTFMICRMLHIYISTAIFSLLILFCVTGITLNHPWMTGSGSEHQVQFALTQLEREQNSEFDPQPLLNLLQDELGLSHANEVSFDLDMGEVTADFSLPAGYAFATWYLDDDLVEVEYHKGTLLAIMNDLHKGRHTGPVWSWVIDIVAVLMLLFALTGLVILFQQVKRRETGLWLILIGTLTPVFIYFLWVPQI